MLSFALVSVAASLWGQEEDPVLFTVEQQEVPVTEFRYIYEKTNGPKADYSRQSLEEYLDLYVKFKLKVQRAWDMELDTIPALRRELEGYRRTLANSYLIDKEITEKLVAEAFERSKEDVDISHIVFSLRPDAIPEDTMVAFNKALEVKRRLEQGADFAVLAREVSEDKTAKQNGGHIGYVTALFPDGYYALETAAYTLPSGKISDPVRTNAGYHLLRVNDRRPARGEIEAAHILLRLKDKDSSEVKMRIDSIYQALRQGAGFEDLAKSLSDDSFTARQGGYIGFFGINRYEKTFEDAAFSIPADGAVSPPVQTSIGWHILKRISKRDIQPFDVERRRLQSKVMNDSRHLKAQNALIESIKAEASFTENTAVLDEFAAGLNDDFFTFRWKASGEKAADVLFTLDPGFEATVGDFEDYLMRESRQRASLGRGADTGQALKTLYEGFADESIMKFEETRLERKYPEFRYLMREYEEGILLFEATQREVWNKASQDTAGLEAFYEKVKDRYRWEERALVSIYHLSSEAGDKLEEVRKYAEHHKGTEVLAKFNAEDRMMLSAEEKMVEKNRNDLLNGVPWQEGALGPAEENSRNNMLTFVKIEEIVPPEIKTLDEARGFIVAEYQDYLEKQWVAGLKENYSVWINDKAFESMVKE